MKGVILAGGTGSRLRPLTEVTNKHLLPVGDWPMIFYPLGRILDAGIQDVLVVTGTEHMGAVVGLLGSGSRFGCRLTYRVQDEAGGIAQAIGLAEGFSAGEPITVVLGDNVFSHSLREAVQKFSSQPEGACIFLKEVPDPERFGVAEVEGDRIRRITEKPSQPASRLAVIGAYVYDARVFDVIRELRPSARGELEVTDVNNAYLERNQLSYEVVRGFWSDAGTFGSLRRATDHVQQESFSPFTRDLQARFGHSP